MALSRSVALALLAGLPLLAAAGWALGPQPRLALVDEGGRIVLSADDALTLSYRHSVALTVVEEDFALASGGAVRVTATRFASSGAGLPSQPEGGGTFSAPGGGAFRVDGMTTELPAVTLRVGPISEQRVLVAGAAPVRLDALAEPGATLTLRGLARPRAAWWVAP